MNIRYKLCLLLYYGFARHLPKSTVPVIGTAAKECVEQYAVIYWDVAAVAIILSKARISGMERRPDRK